MPKAVMAEWFWDFDYALAALELGDESTMSRENVELAKQAVEAVSAGGIEAALPFSPRRYGLPPVVWPPSRAAGGLGV